MKFNICSCCRSSMKVAELEEEAIAASNNDAPLRTCTDPTADHAGSKRKSHKSATSHWRPELSQITEHRSVSSANEKSAAKKTTLGLRKSVAVVCSYYGPSREISFNRDNSQRMGMPMFSFAAPFLF